MIAVGIVPDGSGTTLLFTDYLGKMSPIWRSRVDRPPPSNG